MDIIRARIVERFAGFALVAGLCFCSAVKAVQCLCQDARTGGFTNPSRPTKKIRMSKVVAANGVFQRCRNRLLTNHRMKRGRSVFPGRYNKIAHTFFEWIQRYFFLCSVGKVVYIFSQRLFGTKRRSKILPNNFLEENAPAKCFQTTFWRKMKEQNPSQRLLGAKRTCKMLPNDFLEENEGANSFPTTFWRKMHLQNGYL